VNLPPVLSRIAEDELAPYNRTLRVELWQDGSLIETQPAMNGRIAYRHVVTLFGDTHAIVPTLTETMLRIDLV
jgi:hypothetical protein